MYLFYDFIKIHCFVLNSSPLEDFAYSNYMDNTANDWSPQTGSVRQFRSGTGYPRAGVGKMRNVNSFSGLMSIF